MYRDEDGQIIYTDEEIDEWERQFKDEDDDTRAIYYDRGYEDGFMASKGLVEQDLNMAIDALTQAVILLAPDESVVPKDSKLARIIKTLDDLENGVRT